MELLGAATGVAPDSLEAETHSDSLALGPTRVQASPEGEKTGPGSLGVPEESRALVLGAEHRVRTGDLRLGKATFRAELHECAFPSFVASKRCLLGPASSASPEREGGRWKGVGRAAADPTGDEQLAVAQRAALQLAGARAAGPAPPTTPSFTHSGLRQIDPLIRGRRRCREEAMREAPRDLLMG